MKVLSRILSTALIAFAPQTWADALQIGSEQQQALSLTLYHQDLGLIREQRSLPTLAPGQQVIIEEISRLAQPETLRISNAGQILEQNLNTNLLSQHSLLEHYLGKTLQLARTNPATGEETLSTVRLLSMDGQQALVEHGQRVEAVPHNSHWRFIFPQRPARLLTRPSLSFRSGGTAQPGLAEISYLSSGLDWGMDYVLTLSRDGTTLALDGLATLSNRSGSDYRNASLQLLAGDVVQPLAQPQLRARGAEVMALMADSAAPTREPLGDFHLYQLPGRYNLLDGQQKQISLLSAPAIAVSREYRHSFLVYNRPDSEKQRSKPNLSLSFSHNGQAGPDLPLPAGDVRVFSPDARNQLQFIGGASIPHTAAGEEVQVNLGRAFDVSIERTQTQYSKSYDGVIVGQQLRLSNSRESSALIRVSAHFPQAWELERSSLPAETTTAGTLEWLIEVPGKSDSLLDFRVKLLSQKR